MSKTTLRIVMVAAAVIANHVVWWGGYWLAGGNFERGSALSFTFVFSMISSLAAIVSAFAASDEDWS